jgi:alkylation response protein AidB-like acyl-CoA dehydrogenase
MDYFYRVTAPDATASESTQSTEALLEELRSWLDDNWDPDLTVAQWWERLGVAGWAAPTLPTNAYGRGVPRSDGVRIAQEITAYGAVGAPGGLGLMLAAPTIATHGTQEQIDRYVRAIVTGQEAWCQLFSEPGAGSDLAGLTSRAIREGDEWIVNGQKVWTSLGHMADLGMLLARTDPDAPKHAGISWFVCDMHQPGVEVRPLREMTGNAMFNEVFLSDVRVANDAMIGEPGEGWRVANTTLGHERASLGVGGAGGGTQVTPGTVAGNLERRVGEFAAAPAAKPSKPTAEERKSKPRSAAAGLISFAQRAGKSDDPLVRQRLVELHTLGEVGRLNTERVKATKAAGRDIPGMPNVAKLSMSNVMRLTRDLGLEIAGAQGMLHAYDDEQTKQLEAAPADPALQGITTQALYAQAPPIYGGTDQIQRNIIGERVLGLPKEPGSDSKRPFSELPKNA